MKAAGWRTIRASAPRCSPRSASSPSPWTSSARAGPTSRGRARSFRSCAPLRRRAGVAFDILKAQSRFDPSRLAAIGFYFGGTTVLELGRAGADVAAVVGFHAGLRTTAPGDDAKNIKGKVLVCQGADDPIIRAEERAEFAAEMTAAKVDWQMHLYGGVGHSFTNRAIDAWKFEGFAYDETADRRSWAAMRGLFDEVL